MSQISPAVEHEPAPGGRRHPHRRDIQGLRAVAVLAVFLDHLAGWPRGGFVGVDIFFVISGFLITGLLLREYERTGSISFRSFYARRVKRILPASVLVLAVTTVLASLLFPLTRTLSTIGDALWALGFAGNWRFAVSGTDYFQEGTLPSPLQHYWSLGVEEQYYLLWPLLMVVVLASAAALRTRGRRRRGVGRGPLAVVVLALITASFTWAQAETAAQPTVAYFSTVSRAWELGLGALLAIAAPLLGRLPQAARPVMAWTGLAGMLVSILWLAPGQAGFPAPLALAPVLATALVIVAGTGRDASGPWLLENPVSRYLGDISFSLYLWHWPVMVLLVALTPSDGIRYYLWAVLLAFLLSAGSYHLVEEPLRRARWFRAPRATARERGPVRVRTLVSVGVAAAASVAVVVASVAIRSDGTLPTAVGPLPAGAGTAAAQDGPGGDGPTSVTPESERAGAADGAEVAPVTASEAECLGAAAVVSGEACDGVLGEQLWPSLETFAADTTGQYPCWRSKGQAAFPDCRRGDPRGTIRVALLGDSHAASYLPAIEAVAKRQGWRLDVFTGFACHWYAHDPQDNCYGPLQGATQRLLSAEPYDAVLVTSSRYDDSRPFEERLARYEQAWAPVAARGTRIIALTDVPATSEESLQCLTRVGFSVTDHDCGVPRDEALALVDPLPQVAGRVEGAEVVDLTEYFCPEGFCPAVIGNTVVYRDASAHISATYSRSLTPFLEEALLEVVDG